MAIIVENLKKNFGEKEIFSSVSFRLEDGEKAGLLGANGEGKTTLMRCILGLEDYDGGFIRKNPFEKIGYSSQIADVGGTLWEQLTASCAEIFSVKEKITDTEKMISQEKDKERLETLLADYAALEERYEHLGGYDYERKIKSTAFGLGFCEDDFSRPAKDFSGGQKTRMLLASALLGEPDFLFLDEPTNHLDIAMTEWLEEYLAAFRGGILLISHDRYFLDRIVGKVLHLENKKLKAYKGNYSKWQKQKELNDTALELAYEKQQEHIKATEEYIRRYKAGIKSKQARGRQSQLDRIDLIDAPHKRSSFRLKLAAPTESADKVLVMKGLAVGYNSSKIIEDIDLILQKGEKIALLGDNGKGKSTLLKTVMDMLPAVKGEYILGRRVKAGYFSQGHDGLFGSDTLLSHLTDHYDLSNERARTLLGGMLFKADDVFKTLDDLSGGERARIALLKLLLDGANFLVLDEPTNHLDINAREVVEDALDMWPGSMLFVSHDRYFVSRLATRIWEIDNGRITDYGGDYEWYKSRKLEAQKDESPAAKTKDGKKSQNAGKKEKKPQNIEQKISDIEDALRGEEALLRHLETRMSDPQMHTDMAASQEIAKEHAEQQKKVDELLQRWEELCFWQEES